MFSSITQAVRCCCCLHIINHPGLSTQYLLLSQPLRTNPTLDSANFRGDRLTHLEKVYQNKMDPQGSAGRQSIYKKQENECGTQSCYTIIYLVNPRAKSNGLDGAVTRTIGCPRVLCMYVYRLLCIVTEQLMMWCKNKGLETLLFFAEIPRGVRLNVCCMYACTYMEGMNR